MRPVVVLAVARLDRVDAAVPEADEGEVDVRRAQHGPVQGLDPSDRVRAERVAGHDGPAHVDGALDALDATRQLGPGQPTRDARDERVGDPHDAARRAEPGHEHVRALDVLALHLEVVVDRAQLDPTAVRESTTPENTGSLFMSGIGSQSI